jgi:hypothetical protein
MAKQGQNGQQGDPKAGQSMQHAQDQMNQAKQQLGQGKPQNASPSMQQAANSLQQAAQQMAQQQQQQGEPNQAKEGIVTGLGSKGGGVPDASLLPADMKKYDGKRWGELPGELRTQIIQDMKAKYGDNYARMIKLYFEQVADTKDK